MLFYDIRVYIYMYNMYIIDVHMIIFNFSYLSFTNLIIYLLIICFKK